MSLYQNAWSTGKVLMIMILGNQVVARNHIFSRSHSQIKDHVAFHCLQLLNISLQMKIFDSIVWNKAQRKISNKRLNICI